MTTKQINELKKLLGITDKQHILVEAYKQFKIDATTEEEVYEALIERK